MHQQNNFNSQPAQSGQQGMGRVQENDSMQNRPGNSQDISHIDQQEGNMEHGEKGSEQGIENSPGEDHQLTQP